ncbi:vacuolar protein sorting-associated protein 13 [Drosophila eugracilis]|uniref:vacuolar protein sorting-associated protein 13 n=1 Tax=Drosophila eugracilis TaxID=29029 RepID=UPI0007E6DD7E|nr:vacuolar protein sorting-associated protein 13 [Drosophila eugracilis]XP_017078121.1 vacuolar protein sorting-associated protein 13 [Drosophila eugracilis]XP_017078122.1 vacuolar protein sorting-associated protein 13 [Drosophila eugracilis]
MVFEAVVADVLNKVLGDYIVNLDRNQLKIGIWGGDVVLQNLKIRENALDDLDLPVQLIYGYLGKLVLKIPWKNLYSQPVIVNIEDLYVLVSPNNNVQYNAEKEAKYEMDLKTAALDALEAARKKELEKDQAKHDAGFAEKLTAQIVNNLQVQITNVHLRYEDTTTTGSPFSFGISLHELELYTTNNDWEKCYMAQQASQVFKIANLSCLSAYLNCGGHLYSNDKSALAMQFQTNIACKTSQPNYNYVLGPISCNAKLKLNMNPEFDDPPFERPKIDLTLEMAKLNVGITNTQFDNLMKLGDAMNRQQLGIPYRKYRPYNLSYKGHAKEWWHFAITSILEEEVRKPRLSWTWEHMKKHRECCNTYAQKYKEQCLNKKPPAVLIETCRLLEKELDIFNLLLIRQRVNIEIAKQREAVPEQKSGWFSGWGWGGGAKKEEQTAGQKLVEKFEAAMTGEEKEKMYRAIGYQENTKPTDLPDHYEAIKMNFKLVALEVGLYKDDHSISTSSHDYHVLPSLVLLNFSMATASITQRPAAEAISITAGMKELKVTGLKRNEYIPSLVESKITDEFNLLDVFFETNPLDKLCNQRVKVVARPLQIVYDAPTILALINAFQPPGDVTLSKFEDAASSQISNFKERSATGMQYMIDKKSVLDVDILLMPNILVVPHKGVYEEDRTPLLVLSMGQVHVFSQPRKEETRLQNLFTAGEDKSDILKTVMENAYDRFTVELNDVQMMVVRAGEPWRLALREANSTEMHVLRPVSLKVIAALCVVDNDPRLPKVKVDIDLPAILVNVSEDRVFLAIKVATSIPLPEQNQPGQRLTQSNSRSSMSISNFINKEVKKISSVSSSGPIGKDNSLEEVIQYTNLDVNFSLGEIYFVLMQSSKRSLTTSDISIEYHTPEGEHHPSQIDDLTEEPIERPPRSPPQQILSIDICRLEAHFVSRTFESVASVKLGDINLRQYGCADGDEEVLDVIHTPKKENSSNYLFTVSCTLADKTSPEFSTKYNSTEQLVVANFEVLQVVLHQECLQRLLEVANKFQRNLDVVLSSGRPRDRMGSIGGGDGIKRKLNVILEDTEEIMTTNQMKRRRKVRRGRVVETVKVRVIANLDEVSLLLTTQSRPLAEMNVKKFVSSLIIKSSYTEVNIGLKDIQVVDLNPHTIHKNILSIVGKDAFNCQVVLYNKEETLDYNSDDMKITVDIGCMKIIFLNWFVAGVMNFLNNFSEAQATISKASAAAAETARQKAMDAYETATRMKLNVRIKAPIIIIPISSQDSNALSLDLGLLELTNNTVEMAVDNEERMAVIDEIKLKICDVKISKVVILDGSESVVDELDAVVGYCSKFNMMNPMSCTLSVTRNLSYTWYRDVPELNLSGRLKSIELTLFSDDYALVMMILNRNLSEGLDEFPPSEEPPPEPTNRAESRRHSHGERVSRTIEAIPKREKIHESIKFNLQFDGVIINLMEGEDAGLARFGIYFLSVKGTKLDNGTLSTSVVLCNIQMDDLRQNSKSQIRQYLSRKDWVQPKLDADDIIDACYNERNFMVDVTAIIKEGDTFAEVRVRGFDLIVCIDFMLRLTAFLSLPPEETPRETVYVKVNTIAETAKETQHSVRSSAFLAANELVPIEATSHAAPNQKMNLILHIDEPDIILVENLEDLNTSCIIFNAQVHLNYRSINDKQIINGQIDALKMYMSAFHPERRELTRHYILHPCVVSLQGSTPEEEGMHISLKLSDIIINVSPATIELLNKAMVSVTSGSMAKTANAEESRNYSSLWHQRHFHSRSYWFTKVEQGVDALEIEKASSHSPDKQKTEKCVIEIPSITIVIESGVGYYTKPLISLDTRITAVFNNWSRNLTAHGSLTLNMNYYNKALAEWEPIIELNEVIGRNGVHEYTPWELKFEMGTENVQNEEEDIDQQAMHMKIHSAETLEITLSKTCLGLLSELGEAFSQAIDQKGLIKPDIVAPYVLENDTGFDINLNLRKGIFTLHEVHRGGISSGLNSTLLLSANSEEVDPNAIKTCTISTGGKAFLQTKDLSTLSEEDSEDYTLYVTIGDIDKEIALPVSKSDTRFFNLMRSTSNEPWGIISEVTQEYGTTKVNVHGVVRVHNHFTTSVSIYRRNTAPTAECFQDIYIGRVRPGEVFHVPLHAIYADAKELYFSMRGYRTSVQGISWAASPSDLNYSHPLHCDPTKTFEPLIINARRKKTEVYFEGTNKYTLLSAFYTIHLRPPLYLRNSLPINIQVSVAGCSVLKEDGLDTVSSMQLVDKGYNKEDFLDYGEKPVDSGNVLHLPTVRLASKDNEAKSFLVVRLIQYLEKDWSCATEVGDYADDVITWTFSSYDSEMKVDMDLYVKTENRHGSIMLTLFSPFWMINKTGKMLTYKTETTSVEVLYHPPEYSGPIMFTFRDKFFFDKKTASIRIDNGQWSEKIPLDVAGSIGEVTCFANNQKYTVGVHNHLTQNSLTKQITFIPFYIVCNKCRFDIELQEQSRPADPWLHLEPNQLEPLWPRNDIRNNLVVRVDGKMTPAFDYTEVICTLLKLEDSKHGGINVDVQTTEGGVYITFTDYKPADAPGLLINHTGRQVVYCEKGTKNEQILNARSTIMYAWDDPTGPKVLIFGANKEETDLKRDGIGEVVMQDGQKATWVSFLDGLQRVLLFTDNDSIASRTETTSSLQSITQSIDLRIHGIGLSVINNETGLDILYLGITSSGIIWESKKVTKKRFKEFTITDNALMEHEFQRYQVHKSVNDVQTYKLDNKFPIDFENMILKKTVERNIRRSFYPAIWVSRKSSPFQSQLHVKINRIQVDNQFMDPIFPVVLAPIPPPKSVANTTCIKPFIECSMVQRIMPNSPVRQFKYARILIQEFHFKVDLNFLTAIAEMFAKEVSDDTAAKQFRQDVESIELPLSAFFEEHSLEEQKSFYDNLHLGPLKIHVSFSMAGSDTKALPGFLGSLVQGVGVTLTDVNDVVFRLAFFERNYQFFSQKQLVNEITSHYTGQALKQLYVLVLGLDVLGNPYGLVVGLKKGVQDLFYEPFQGAIQGPGEFAEGLVLGVKSLFGHTVGGAAGAVSKITGAMGKGLAALTFDEDYQKKRRQGIQNKPKNFHEGLARSSKGLVMGFVDGVTGVVTKPVTGARDNGVEGFFKGLGKGAIGLVARPTAGVVDFASGSFEAVKRAADASEDAKRMRPPRFQHYDFVLRPYCSMEATGNKIMKETDKGKFATTDNFVHCEEIIQKSEYLVVTNYRLMYVQRNEMFGVWTSLWSYLWAEISAVAPAARGVQFTVKTDGKKVLGLFSSKESPRKLVLVGDERKRDALINIIESQRSDPNPLKGINAYPAKI